MLIVGYRMTSVYIYRITSVPVSFLLLLLLLLSNEFSYED